MDSFSRHLTAAQGYIELGMFLDANAELEEIDAEQRHLPEVLALRLKIYFSLKKWDLMQIVARSLALSDPDNAHWTSSWAYATRRSDSLEAARIILVNAVERQPNVAIFHYNLACYECQLGNLDTAKGRLKRAIELDAAYSLKALDDEDLAAIWDTV